MERKRMIINLVSSMFSFIVLIGISFWLTPFIVKNLGNEAYGFIGLANNFVSYASVVTIALNSVASRFITIKIHQNKNKEANIYFNSVLIANAVIAIILSLIGMFIIVNLEKLVRISESLVGDVKITFAFIFINFIINIIASIFTISTFVRNRIDISSLITVEGNILRVIILVVLFYFFKPRLFYIGIAILIMSIFNGLKSVKYTRIFLPNISISLKEFSFKAIKEIISLGIWNSINSLSDILLTGLDLLIANILISPESMGLLSIAKSMPNVIVTFLYTLGNVYAAKFTILYAKNNIDELIREIKLSMKVLGMIVTVPLAGFAIFGGEFYKLWVGNLSNNDLIQVQILSILTLGPMFVSAFLFSLYNVSTITNKLKTPVLLTLSISIISTGIVIILLKTTNLGLYAIAGVSSLLMSLRVIFFVPTYAAHCLGVKLTTFYKPMIRGLFSFGIISTLFFIVHKFYFISSWGNLVIIAALIGSIGYVLNIGIVLNRNERKVLSVLIKNKIGKYGIINAKK